MGSQLSVCLTPSDTQQLENQLLRAGPFVVLSARTLTNKLERIPQLSVQEMGKEPLMVFLARAVDVTQIVLRPIPSAKGWSIDPITQPVLEFSRPFFADGAMRPGRLYFTTGFYAKDDNWREKDVEFVRWATRVLSICRRVLERDAAHKLYWGPEASELRDADKLTLLADNTPPRGQRRPGGQPTNGEGETRAPGSQ